MFASDNLERVVTSMIALLLIATSLVITVLSAVNGHNFTVPTWLLDSTTLVIGYYFGKHASVIQNNNKSTPQAPTQVSKPLQAGTVGS